MPSYHEQYTAPFLTSQVFDLVADVEKYPEFLPWCRSCRIIKRLKTSLIVELSIYFSFFSYKYTSKVIFNYPKKPHSICHIKVGLVKGPFDTLNNVWSFRPADKETLVTFDLNFQANSTMVNKTLASIFIKSAHRISSAFQARAKEIYLKPYKRIS